jgi:hypothetical protein
MAHGQIPTRIRPGWSSTSPCPKVVDDGRWRLFFALSPKSKTEIKFGNLRDEDRCVYRLPPPSPAVVPAGIAPTQVRS